MPNIKVLILLSVVAYCTAEDYYKMRIDHDYKGLLDTKKYGTDAYPTSGSNGGYGSRGKGGYKSSSGGNDGYKTLAYDTPQNYGHRRQQPQHDDYYDTTDDYQNYKKPDYEVSYAPKYESNYETKYEPKYEAKYEPKYETKYEPKYEPKYEVKYEPKYETKYESPKYQSMPKYQPQYEKASYGAGQGTDGYGLSYGQQSYGKADSYEPTYEKTYEAPVHAYRHVEIKPIQTQGYGYQKDHLIDVKDDQPIVIHFRTHANRIKVEQTRIPDHPREVEHQKSEDEPHRVVHEVYKPVIQEVREIIQPFRKVVQQVQPVVEEIETVVHKAANGGRRNHGGGGGDDGGDYGHQKSSRSYGRANKKYVKDYLPQGSAPVVQAIKGQPSVYRSPYNRQSSQPTAPVLPHKNN